MNDWLAKLQVDAVNYINQTIREGGEVQKIWWQSNRCMIVCLKEVTGKLTAVTLKHPFTPENVL